jgi:prepilin-type processing-associated H-X9-DG protein
LLAADMIVSTTAGWAIRNNHLDGKSHKLPDPQAGAGQTVTTQAVGGNVLYNDGHVVWVRTEDAKVRTYFPYLSVNCGF